MITAAKRQKFLNFSCEKPLKTPEMKFRLLNTNTMAYFFEEKTNVVQ